MAETTNTTIVLGEQAKVVYHRYREARVYGLTKVEAMLYAESEIDCADLRRLKRAKCPPETAVRILL